ncbi:MAG: hypothetical protein B5M55_04195 [Desulfococcus sp. 4484_242]|nr:MAG: hypothetical protein B5M55_04195 [Desulfococcus sp. 4484_242]
MIEHADETPVDGIIATIENRDNPSQIIAIKYLPEEQSFVTSGIQLHFGEKELLIPAHLVIVDLELMGAIVSGILEEISRCKEMETTFEYVAGFEVLDRKYTLTEHGPYMKMESQDQ